MIKMKPASHSWLQIQRNRIYFI